MFRQLLDPGTVGPAGDKAASMLKEKMQLMGRRWRSNPSAGPELLVQQLTRLVPLIKTGQASQARARLCVPSKSLLSRLHLPRCLSLFLSALLRLGSPASSTLEFGVWVSGFGFRVSGFVAQREGAVHGPVSFLDPKGRKTVPPHPTRHSLNDYV